MKKRFSFIFTMALSLILLLPMTSQAKVIETMEAEISKDIIITVNGEEVPFKVATINGQSYLPVRVIGYALNSEVDWINLESKITLNTKEERLPYKEFSDLVSINSGKRIAARVDDMSLFLNNEYNKDISQQIILIESRSYLPIRNVSENLGIRSTWNAETRTIEIINPRTVEISETEKPYYVKELPKIEKQEDYLVGNWKGYANLNGAYYEKDVFISKNDDGSYKVINKAVVSDGREYTVEQVGYYKDGVLETKLLRYIYKNYSGGNYIDDVYSLKGDTLYQIKGSDEGRLERF